VDHPAGNVLGRIDIPQLLDAQAIDLRLAILVQRKALLELLGKMAARASAKNVYFACSSSPGV